VKPQADERIKLVVAIEEWVQLAEGELWDIGGWRDADPVARNARYWGGRPAPALPRLWDCMAPCIVEDVNRLLPSLLLDSRAIFDVHQAVIAWHEDRDARNIPSQAELLMAFARAKLVLGTARARLCELATSTATTTETTSTPKPPAKPRGRPRRNADESAADARIAMHWYSARRSNPSLTYEQHDADRDYAHGTTRAAVDRHRQATKRKRNKPS